MTRARLDQLIDACLDGDATLRPELEAALRASPAARQAWWRAIQIHAGLHGALRARSATVSGARMRRASPGRRRTAATFPLRWVLAAVAAVLLVAVGLLTRQPAAQPVAQPVAQPAVQAAVSALARITAGTGVGRELIAGDEVVATSATTITFTGEATVVRLEPGARLRVDRPHHIALVLASGVMTIKAAPQPVDYPLRVTTPHAELRVIGTVFQVAVAQATDVRVDHGTVAVRSAGDEVHVSAGGEARCCPGETPRQGGRLLRLFDDFIAGSDSTAWNNDSLSGLERQLVPDGFLDGGGCRLRFLPDSDQPSPWAGMRFATPQDWRGASGISIALRGSGKGGILLLEILDDGPASAPGEIDHAERFQVVIRDDRSGWREWRLPFKAFQRRDMQFPGAPADGLTLSAVQGLSLIQHTTPLDVVVDRLGLYRE